MEVSYNRGTPKSSILMGFSLPTILGIPPFVETPKWQLPQFASNPFELSSWESIGVTLGLQYQATVICKLWGRPENDILAM